MILALKTADHTTQVWVLAASEFASPGRRTLSVSSVDPVGGFATSLRSPEPTPAGGDETPPAATQPDLSWESGRQLSDELLSRLTSLLQEHGHQFSDLTGIIIFSGPGSFTSLRIGHTVVNALADSLGIPVTGATGDDWLTKGQAAIPSVKPGVPALPHYGAEANITKPRLAS
jgi:tRNA threonylcarbamoyladenosine biosynthesis protein TsaB